MKYFINLITSLNAQLNTLQMINKSYITILMSNIIFTTIINITHIPHITPIIQHFTYHFLKMNYTLLHYYTPHNYTLIQTITNQNTQCPTEINEKQAHFNIWTGKHQIKVTHSGIKSTNKCRYLRCITSSVDVTT